MNHRALVLCDDAWHPAEMVHRGLSKLADARFDFEFVTPGDRWAAGLDAFPVVVVAKANHVCATDRSLWLTTETQRTIREFVQHGGGLLLVHGGCCYQDLSEMRGVTGGAFLRHPDQCAVTIEPVPGHPLTNGVRPFTERDEHYLMALDAPEADVFLCSRSEHGVQPAGWTRTEGDGRVCALTPGHNLEVWLHSDFQRLLCNGLNWVAKLN